MSVFKSRNSNMIFQCDGGPGGGRRNQDQDESYSEEEESSSTSAETEGDDEEEEEEGESEEEEEDSSSSSDSEENDEEEQVAQRKPTRNSGQTQASSLVSSRLKVDSQRGRLTRQKAREEMPSKRLLRSRNKSPAAGQGCRVPQVFKCLNCKKEFNSKVSLSRHGGWCKQKSTKSSSPRKRKNEDGSKSNNNTPKRMEKVQSQNGSKAPQTETDTPSSAPRKRGRPRKNPVPSASESTADESSHPNENHLIMQQRHQYHEEMMMMNAGARVLPSSSAAEEDFMQQKSPESSPGIMESSSEEDYEQKEFAANAHQLISHRNNVGVPIDVVSADQPGEPEGPVTCPQCKMTYRTVLGYQNHIPNCAPFSSDEEENEFDVADHNDQVPQFQGPNGPNWTAHHTLPETVIAPPPQPMEVESSPESTTSSDDGGIEVVASVPPEVQEEQSIPTPVTQHSPQKYQEISISPSGVGRSPLKIILPPDNTPQVINASGLTLERLEMSPATKTVTAHTTTGSTEILEPHQKCPTPKAPEVTLQPILPPPPQAPPPTILHSALPQNNIAALSNLSHSTSSAVYPSTGQYHHSSAQEILSHAHPPTAPIPTPLPTVTPKTIISSPSASSVSIQLNPHVHAGGNPPTYTQAQLMPGTVLHNSIMPVPPQQMSTTTGEAYHLHHPASSQPLPQFPGSHYPLCHTTQATSTPQPTFRVQNSIPGIHSSPPGLSSFITGTNTQSQQQLQMATAIAQAQMLRHTAPEPQRLPSPFQQQAPQFGQQLPTVPAQSIGQIPTSQVQGGNPIPGQHPVFVNANNNLGSYGIGSNLQHSTLSMPIGNQHLQQNPQIPNGSALPYTQMVQQQQQLPQSVNGLNPQQIQIPQQQTVSNATLQNSSDGTQQFNALQSQLPQYQQYLQSLHSNLQKMPDNLGQSPQSIQQQTVFTGQQNIVPPQPVGLSLQQQLQQLQQRGSTQLLQPNSQTLHQQQNAHQSIFQQPVASQNTGQLPGTQSFMQPFPPAQSQQPSENIGPIPGMAPPQQHQQPSQSITVNSDQSSDNIIHQGQMELNLQQQIQLQQQQQQFLALQQQMQLQQNSDQAKPQHQPQPQSQNLQAVMINGSLQWIKTGQLSQSTQIQIPQQQQHQPISNETALTTSSHGQIVQTSQHQVQQAGLSPAVQSSQQPQQHQQALPQVIQQLAQVTDNAGNTYIIIAPSQPQQQQGAASQNGTAANAATGNTASPLLNLIPGLQTVPCQQQQQVQRLNSSSSLVQCSANGGMNHSSSSSSTSPGNTFHSVGRSAPCPCVTCKEKTITASAMDKYKKVLPYPSANESHHHQSLLKTISPNIAPKQPISIRPAIPKQPKIVRVSASAASTRPAVQLAFTQSVLNPNLQHPGHQSQVKGLPPQQQIGLVTVTSGGGSAPISSPNIAVVRPMENPLQRLSDQISQIESTFMSTPPPPTGSTLPIAPSSPMLAHTSSPRQGPHLTLVTTSPTPPPLSSSPITVSSISPSQHVTHVITLDPPPMVEVPSGASTSQIEIEDSVMNIPVPRLALVDHGTPPPIRQPPSSTASPALSPQLSSPGSSIQSISAPSTPAEKGSIRTTTGARAKRKILQNSPSGGEPEAKTIKVQLHKRMDKYSIANIEVNSAKVNGSFKSLKIACKIKKSKVTGAQEGTATNVVVAPSIRLQPNPDPDTNEGNITISEDENENRDNDVNAIISQRGGDNNNNNNGSRANLNSYRAVVVWEVRMESNNKVLFKSSDVRDVWDRVFQIAQGTRLNHNLPPISYPATNIALPQNEMAAKAMFNDLGLTHKAIQFLLKQLPLLQSFKSTQQSPKLPYPGPSPPTTSSSELLPLLSEGEQQTHQRRNDGEEAEELVEGNVSGCARFERFTGRKSFDMFGWLTSKHRDPPTECDAPMESLKFLSAPIGMRYRKLKEKAREYLVIRTSEIHGRGLFTKRDIEKGEMIIEYAGEVIRPLVCDMREKYYESKAIGCYMFRINDHVIDATMRGNAARFINHSCEPNCEARAVRISGKDHIIIFSLRQIGRGEELTYDYSFEKEEEKIICTCRSKYCRKYLN